jgi:uncharacterized protein (DUF3820 family)
VQSKRTLPWLQTPIASSQPPRSVVMQPPSAPQPRPSKQSIAPEPPLYRFPWGIHKGKTLLDVPGSYFSYLELQGNIDHMAGLKEAIALFRQRKPPIDMLQAPQDRLALLEVPSSPCRPPPSTAPARAVAASTGPLPMSMPHYPDSLSQHSVASSTVPSPPVASASSPEQYRFNFGIHTGKTISEVPYDYISFLKE